MKLTHKNKFLKPLTIFLTSLSMLGFLGTALAFGATFFGLGCAILGIGSGVVLIPLGVIVAVGFFYAAICLYKVAARSWESFEQNEIKIVMAKKLAICLKKASEHNKPRIIRKNESLKKAKDLTEKFSNDFHNKFQGSQPKLTFEDL